jgi:hypothetical protein
VKKILIAAGLFVIGCWSLPGQAWTNVGDLDVSKITSVVVEGDAAEIHLTTRADTSYRAQLRSRPRGWFGFWVSSWAADRCEGRVSMTVSGTTLRVSTPAAGGWSLFDGDDDCRLALSANLPAGAAVSIDQNASLARLDGEFGILAIKSRAGDIAINGHARAIGIEGNAVQAKVDFDRIEGDETIGISGNALDADLRFPAGTKVDYQATGNAALVDSPVASTPGAKPQVRISGNFVRARIR